MAAYNGTSSYFLALVDAFVFYLVLFVIGSRWYRKYPPQGNVFVLVSATMFVSIFFILKYYY